MTARVTNDELLHGSAVSAVARNRIVAIAPIAVALLGVGILAISSGGRDSDQLIGTAASLDTVVTGSVRAGQDL